MALNHHLSACISHTGLQGTLKGKEEMQSCRHYVKKCPLYSHQLKKAPHKQQLALSCNWNGFRSPRFPRSSLQIVPRDSLVLPNFQPILLQYNSMLSIHVSLDQTHTGSGNVSTLKQWLPLCATHSFPSTSAPLWKSPGREILLHSLPKGFCITGMWLHRGWQIPQLSCQSSSDAKLQGCSPRGSLFSSGGNCISKISLHLLLYWIKGFGNSCLSGWELELCGGRDRLSLSDVSTTNTWHHLWFQGRALDPFPTLLCFPCHLPSTELGRHWKKMPCVQLELNRWKTHVRNGCMFTLCPRFPRVLRRGWDRWLCLTIRKAWSRSNRYIKVT